MRVVEIPAKEQKSQGIQASRVCSLLLVFAIALMGADASPTQQGTISGTVRNSSGQALSGVRITLASYDDSHTIATAVSSSTGSYIFERLETRKYVLTAGATGFEESTPEVIDLSSRNEVVVDLRLVPLRAAQASFSSQPSEPNQNHGPAEYYEGSSLTPADISRSIDLGGYSAAARADSSRQLLQGAAQLRSDLGSEARGSAHAPFPEEIQVLAAREQGLKKAVEANPESFEANHNLGEFYVQHDESSSAVPYLERAYHLNPSHYANAYDMALAYVGARQLSAARQQLRAMTERKDTAELHKLLAEVEEGSGNFVGAGNEYRRAAQMDRSEQNLFDWGCELLLHQSVELSIDSFKDGIGHYPGSAKLWIGLGVALYSRGRYDDGISALLRATDLNPSDPRPYLFLGKAYDSSRKEAGTVADRLKRFADLEPGNAQAIYYYAVSLWKGKREDDPQAGSGQVETLLKRSASLDPAFPNAHLQLGILYAGQHKYAEAIGQYRQAIQLDPDMADAHYRLGQACLRTGQKEQAQQEFELYERLRKAQIADDKRFGGELLRFVQTTKEHSPSLP